MIKRTLLSTRGTAGGREQCFVEDEGTGEVEAGGVAVWGPLVRSFRTCWRLKFKATHGREVGHKSMPKLSIAS